MRRPHDRVHAPGGVHGSLRLTEPFRFTLCADDYAMTPAVSRGILEALDAGALSATSVMTTSRWWPDHAEALRAFDGHADIGLHLNLTLGAPLGPCPRLAPDGSLPPIGRYLRAAGLPLEEIGHEIGRQLDAFEAVFGRPPDHLDGHQHVHALAPVRALVLAQLDRRGLAGRIWVRDSADRIGRIARRGSCVRKALGLAWLGRGGARAAEARGYRVNDGFAGFSDFKKGADYAGLFARFLVEPGRRHLVMCHPGRVDDALRALDPVVETREEELAFLLSPAFREVLSRRGATLSRLAAHPMSRTGRD